MALPKFKMWSRTKSTPKTGPSAFSGVFKEMSNDRIQIIADLLCKLVGESVQSKLIRAALMGAIAAGTQLAQSDTSTAVTPPPAVFQPAANAATPSSDPH